MPFEVFDVTKEAGASSSASLQERILRNMANRSPIRTLDAATAEVSITPARCFAEEAVRRGELQTARDWMAEIEDESLKSQIADRLEQEDGRP